MSFSWTGFISLSVVGMPPGLISILLISFFVTLFQLLIYKKFSNQERIKEIKEKQKKLQKEIKEIIRNKDQNQTKLNELNKEMFELSSELMKLNFKPLIYTFIPLIIIFWLLKESYSKAGITKIITWSWKLPLIGNGAGWLLCFIFFSLIFNLSLRKILKIH